MKVSKSTKQPKNDRVENLAALGAAPALCDFHVNEQIITMSVSALFDSPNDVSPGGKYWPEILQNLERIKNLTSTKAGQTSFCSLMRSNLSAFID